MKRTLVLIGSLAALAATVGAQADTRPTLAVMPFTNGALGSAQQELAPLSAGMQDLLINQLAANSKIRVVERGNLVSLMNEQNLSASGRVDPSTAAKLGKILGAGHMLFGGFVVDTKGNMKITARSVNVETTVVEWTTSVEGKEADLMAKITELANQVDGGLKLPALSASMKDAQIDQAKKVPFQATMLYSRALAAKDAGNNAEAVQLLQKSLAAFPEFAPAQSELKKLQPAAGTQ